MEFGTIEREVFIEASPEVVFDVVSSPAHVRQWWPDEARFEPVAGCSRRDRVRRPGCGRTLSRRSRSSTSTRRGCSRSGGPTPRASQRHEGNSLLVTFQLTAQGGGTLLKMTESGFREMGWRSPCSSSSTTSTSRAGTSTCLASLRASRSCSGRRERGRHRRAVDDELWSAIGDPTRRRILDLLLAAGDGTATTLSEQLPVTRQAVAKHLTVLERPTSSRRGRRAGRSASGSTTPSSPVPSPS